MIGRLLTMDRRELGWRIGHAATTAVQRARWRVRGPRWRRARIASLLGPQAPREARRAAARGDSMMAHAVLARHFASRPRRFPLHPLDRARLVPAVGRAFPDAPSEAHRRATRILSGRYDVLGYTDLSFGTPVDWHLDPVRGRRAPLAFWSSVPFLDPSLGDHKIIWELNRHQHWLALGRAYWLLDDDRCRARVLDELESWLDANPPLTGINWTSMLELAFRSMSWLWTIHFFADAVHEDGRPWLVDLLVALDAQLAHVARNLSRYFSPNTHLTGEALGLYLAGCALPELRGSLEWRRLGRQVLLEEIRRQVLPDGGHVERSTHYHRYSLDFYLLALTMARLTGDERAERRFRDAAERQASYARAIAADDGRIPLIGDDDGGMLFPICGRDSGDVTDTLDVAACLLGRDDLAVGAAEETSWLLGGWMDLDQASRTVPGAAAATSAAARFDDTGYYVARPAPGTHLVFDVGRHGYLNGGHAHADALSVTLTLAGRPIVVDPGTAVYTVDAAMRDRFRATAAHNTVVVGGRSQSEPAGPFQWRSRADARPLTWHAGRALLCFEASHDGYAPAEHRRAVVCFDGLVVIADWVLGVAAGTAVAAHWHLHPDWRAEMILDSWDRDVSLGGCCRLTAGGNGTSAVWVATSGAEVGVHHAGGGSGLGWMSPRYGRVAPATTLVAAARPRPVAIVTVFGAGESPRRIRQLEIPIRDAWHRIGIAIERNPGPLGYGADAAPVDLFLFATERGRTQARPGAPSHPRVAVAATLPATWPTGGIETDARIAAVGVAPNGSIRVAEQVGGRRLRAVAPAAEGVLTAR